MINGKVLVVGATGQLGSEIVMQACQAGDRVRALVRRGSRYSHLEGVGAELAFGDLRDRASLIQACQGVSVVVATASIVFPQGTYSFEEDEHKGYKNLLSACSQASISRFVFISNLAEYTPEHLSCVPTLHYKREVERMIEASGIPFTIIRSAPFMDDYFALMGSEIPLRGEEAATLKRRFWFSRISLSLSMRAIERWGVGFCPGSRNARHQFIAVADVGRAVLEAIGDEQMANQTLELGGPTAVSWKEVGDLYASLLGRSVRVVPIPAVALWWCSKLLRPVSLAAANQIAILWLLASSQRTARPWPGSKLPEVDAHTYLSSKLKQATR